MTNDEGLYTRAFSKAIKAGLDPEEARALVDNNQGSFVWYRLPEGLDPTVQITEEVLPQSGLHVLSGSVREHAAYFCSNEEAVLLHEYREAKLELDEAAEVLNAAYKAHSMAEDAFEKAKEALLEGDTE